MTRFGEKSKTCKQVACRAERARKDRRDHKARLGRKVIPVIRGLTASRVFKARPAQLDRKATKAIPATRDRKARPEAMVMTGPLALKAIQGRKD